MIGNIQILILPKTNSCSDLMRMVILSIPKLEENAELEEFVSYYSSNVAVDYEISKRKESKPKS
jgi:hypothetical protein